ELEGQSEGKRGCKLHAALLTSACFAQIMVGAAMRHQHVGLIIQGFPLSDGKLVPEFYDWRVGLNFAHRMGGFLVAALALSLGGRILKGSAQGALRRPALALSAAVTVQFLMGAASVWSRLRP